MAACAACRAELVGSPRFCPECGARLAGPSAQREVRKTVTVLFGDVAGSTAMGERLDPESVRALMGRWFAGARAAVERHGGTVEKFVGDAVMAVFGIPAAHEDDALRAVRAAVDIQAALTTLGAADLRVRIGINTGEVVAGDAGDNETLVTGDTVNTAARLEQAALPGDILLGAGTYRLVRDAVDAVPTPPVVAKGKSEPVSAWRLVSIAGDESRTRRLDQPLVGRERDLDALRQAFGRSRSGDAVELATVIGAAGVGKSRLIAEFVAALGRDTIVLKGRCLPYGDGITYWPIREVVHAAAGVVDGDDREGASARLRGVLQGAREGDLVGRRIASAIGLSDEPAPQEEIFWATRMLFEHLAASRPLVVVVEDIHWGESALLDLLEYLADVSAGVPLLLLCPSRPELLAVRPGWGAGRANSSLLRLDPLSDDDVARMLDTLPGGSALPAALRRRILDAAEGNPLFVQEMVGMLVDEGNLVLEGDQWRTAGGLERVAIPPTIEALLTARIDALPIEERRIAERASVVGRVFEAAAVRALAGDLGAAVARTLLALVRKELLKPDRSDLTAGDAFRFRHLLIRDAAYRALPKLERAELHERFADWLESVAGDRLTEYEEVLAHHLAEAARFRIELADDTERTASLRERAVDRLVVTARRALDRGDGPSATALYGVAYELGSFDMPAIRREAAYYGIALMNSGRRSAWPAIVEEAQVAAERYGDRSLAMRVRLLSIESIVSDGSDAEALLPEIRELAAGLTALDDHWGAARAWCLAADTDLGAGRASDAVATAELAVREAEAAGDAREHARGSHALISAMAYGSMPAIEGVRRGRQIVDAVKANLGFKAICQATLGCLVAMTGEVPEAQRLIRSAGELAGRVIDPGYRGIVDIYSGWCESIIGNHEAAAAAFARWRDGGAGAVHGETAERFLDVVIAECLVRLGRVAEAEAQMALASEGPLLSRTDEATRLRVQALLAAAQGQYGAAEGLIARARAMLIEMQVPADRAQVELDSAHIDASLGNRERAGQAAAAALELFRAKGHVPGATAAQGLMDSLAANSLATNSEVVSRMRSPRDSPCP